MCSQTYCSCRMQGIVSCIVQYHWCLTSICFDAFPAAFLLPIANSAAPSSAKGQLSVLVLAVLAALSSPVNAYKFGVGDGLAIVLFVVIGIVATCAMLGWIARRRANSS